MTLIRKLVLPALGVFTLLLLGCGDGRTPLVIYSPHGRDLLTLVETTFEEANPGVDVRQIAAGSNTRTGSAGLVALSRSAWRPFRIQ